MHTESAYSYSNACSKYGASMGRYSTPVSEAPTAPIKLYLQRVRLDSGGYDPGGAYWEVGEPLYVAFDADRDIEMFTRAADREHAKHLVVSRFPTAMFYR